MLVNADFHIHSSFSGGSSEKIDLKNLAIGAKKKGLNILGTGDCLHEKWQKEIKKYYSKGKIEVEGINFVLTCEVEDKNRVHHLLLFPDFDSVEQFKESVKNYIKDEFSGRPKIFAGGNELIEISFEANALVGPAHAFTPYTSLYAYFNSVLEYYGKKPSFVELGLSADSNYADRIKELNSLPFLTNSDAHSSSPHRLGREFNRIEINEFSWDEIKNAIAKGKIAINAGYPPEKGKYNRTACCFCYRIYEKNEAEKMGWKCRCGGKIKKGVKDRIDELADYDEPVHPENRARYVHLIPLVEIIASSLRISPYSSLAIKRWEELLSFGSEINLLLDANLSELRKKSPQAIIDAIASFREGKIKIIPGGGGKYGELII
ncbi:MAG: TIGR00375 family protein [Thermoplasmatales archaeon]|nr:TIGR00375 family protein [Thermoplasmatales archaeon]